MKKGKKHQKKDFIKARIYKKFYDVSEMYQSDNVKKKLFDILTQEFVCLSLVTVS